MDGTRDGDALPRAIFEAIDMEPGIAGPSAPDVANARIRASSVRASVERLLRVFARNGLLDED